VNAVQVAALIAVLCVGAFASYYRPSAVVARALASLTFLLSLWAAVRAIQHELPAQPGALLESDDLSALFLPLSALIACAVLFASPLRDLTGRALASVLLSLAAAVGAYCAGDLTVFVAAWCLGLYATSLALPAAVQHARLAKAYKVYAALGTIPLLLALAILYRAHDSSFHPSSTANNVLSVRTQHAVFVLLALAAAFRSGLFPLHSWLPALTGRAPVATTAMIFGAQLGPVLVARAMVPLTPLVAQGDMSAFSTWAVASALYAALLGLVQKNLKRTLGFVLTSQSALLLFGVSGTNSESMHGALLGVVALGLTATGLLLVAGSLEVRTGTDDIVSLRGRGRAFPRMTALFFLLAAAAIGLPGTLPFVAEDLLLHGLLHTNVKGAIALLVVTVLNGITLLRVFFDVFQGPTRDPRPERRSDLTPREALVIGGLLLVTFIAGLSPRILLALQDHSVRALSHTSLNDPGHVAKF
jgi:NADH-quinone oxidoreductase subunit M